MQPDVPHPRYRGTDRITDSAVVGIWARVTCLSRTAETRHHLRVIALGGVPAALTRCEPMSTAGALLLPGLTLNLPHPPNICNPWFRSEIRATHSINTPRPGAIHPFTDKVTLDGTGVRDPHSALSVHY